MATGESNTKICSACREALALALFGRDRSRPDGRQRTCLSCHSGYAKTHKAERKLREAAATPEMRKRRREYFSNYYAAHKGVIVRRSRVWVEENRERRNRNLRGWNKANSAKLKMFSIARRAREYGARTGCRKSYARFVEWANRDAPISCYWCKRKTVKEHRHLDHVIPLSKGGPDSVGNLCVSCRTCNLKKNAKMPEQFCGQTEIVLL